MTRVNTEWNRRMFDPTEEPVFYTCPDCKVEQEWKQRGAVPLRCYPCSVKNRAHEDPHMPYDFGRFGMEGDLCERLLGVLHWSPSLKRWMYFDGSRWGKGTEVDAYKIVLELLRQSGMAGKKRKHRKYTFGARVDVEGIMSKYREQCEETVRVHGGM